MRVYTEAEKCKRSSSSPSPPLPRSTKKPESFKHLAGTQKTRDSVSSGSARSGVLPIRIHRTPSGPPCDNAASVLVHAHMKKE